MICFEGCDIKNNKESGYKEESATNGCKLSSHIRLDGKCLRKSLIHSI